MQSPLHAAEPEFKVNKNQIKINEYAEETPPQDQEEAAALQGSVSISEHGISEQPDGPGGPCFS